ncbi:MAG: alpha/beta hydrolase [Trueperaceae bacterium]|nr:alpha/beta hydrolase [Trueperaceae bacterium]
MSEAETYDEAVHVERPGADLYVEQVGPKTGRTVYYLHGGPGYHAHAFRDLLGDDLERYRMIYADQRGGGRSYADAPFDLDVLADDVAAVLEVLGAAPASLLAHAFGATVAVRAALRHPERIDSIVLVNPWFSMPMLARTLQREAAQRSGRPDTALPPEGALADAEALDPLELVDTAFGQVSAKTLFDALEFPDPSTRLRLEHSDATALLGPTATAGIDAPWRVDVLRDLTTLTTPTVVVSGTRDGTAFPDQVEAGLARLPEAMSGLLDAGHYPWIDDPASFLQLLEDALPPA